MPKANGDQQVSFRWGIPWLDQGFLQVPNFFLYHYAQLGIKPQEFLFVLHLASYKYESPNGSSHPSLTTISQQMGLSLSQVRRYRASLEGRGLLEVTQIPGRPSEYNFRGLALALADLDIASRTDATPRMDDRGTPVTHDRGPHAPMTGEEQETTIRRQQQQDAAASCSQTRQETARQALLEVGVEDRTVRRLCKNFPPQRIIEMTTAAKMSPHIRDPAAWVVAGLDRSFQPAPSEVEQRRRTVNNAQIANCAYHLHPELGECPSQRAQRATFEWCRRCHLLEKVPISA